MEAVAYTPKKALIAIKGLSENKIEKICKQGKHACCYVCNEEDLLAKQLYHRYQCMPWLILVSPRLWKSNNVATRLSESPLVPKSWIALLAVNRPCTDCVCNNHPNLDIRRWHWNRDHCRIVWRVPYWQNTIMPHIGGDMSSMVG